MKLHDHTAYRIALASMLAATAFGCRSFHDAVEEEGSAELEIQSEDNRCCPQGDHWSVSAPSPEDVFFDNNQDGLICVRFVNGQGSSRDVPAFSIKDNNNPCESESCQDPGGSYVLTCSGCSQSGDTLACSCCITLEGDCQSTQIDVCSCTTEISNCDGSLTCGGCNSVSRSRGSH
jgi:hypothetical protein